MIAANLAVIYKKPELLADRHIIVARTNAERNRWKKFAHDPARPRHSEHVAHLGEHRDLADVRRDALSIWHEARLRPFMLVRGVIGAKEGREANLCARLGDLRGEVSERGIFWLPAIEQLPDRALCGLW